MPRTTPKTNWIGGNIPLAPDLNRIEGNAQQAFDELDEEVSARIADVNAEEARATAVENSIIADLGGVDFVNGNAGTYSSRVIGQNEVWVIPKGLYIFTCFPNSLAFQIKSSGGEWAGFTLESWQGGMILSDGVNFAVTGLNVSTPGTVFYRKLS